MEQHNWYSIGIILSPATGQSTPYYKLTILHCIHYIQFSETSLPLSALKFIFCNVSAILCYFPTFTRIDPVYEAGTASTCISPIGIYLSNRMNHWRREFLKAPTMFRYDLAVRGETRIYVLPFLLSHLSPQSYILYHTLPGTGSLWFSQIVTYSHKNMGGVTYVTLYIIITVESIVQIWYKDSYRALMYCVGKTSK